MGLLGELFGFSSYSPSIVEDDEPRFRDFSGDEKLTHCELKEKYEHLYEDFARAYKINYRDCGINYFKLDIDGKLQWLELQQIQKVYDSVVNYVWE